MIAGMEHICYVCANEEEKLINRDCPAIGHADTLILVNKPVCSPCFQRLHLIDQYVRIGHLRYGDHTFNSKVLQNLPNLELGQDKDLEEVPNAHNIQKTGSLLQKGQGNDERGRSRSDCRQLKHLRGKASANRVSYCGWLLKHILEENFVHLSVLPFPILHLLSLVSPPSLEERQHKLKQILKSLAMHYSLSHLELKQVVMVANVLLCHMDANKTGKIMAKLSEMVARGLLTWKDIIDNDQKMEIDKLWLKIEIIIEKSQLTEEQFDSFIEMLQGIPQLKTFEDFKLMLNKISSAFPIQSVSTPTIPISEFIFMKDQKNAMQLILLSLAQDEEAVHASLTALQSKHKKEKDEYITKIVKLNNIIEDLNKEIEELKSKTAPEINPQPIIDQISNDVKFQIEQKHQNSTEDQQQISQSDSMTYLQSIITMTDLMSLNEKLAHLIVTPRNSHHRSISNHHHNSSSGHRSSSTHHNNLAKKSISVTTIESNLPSTPQALCNRIISEINTLQTSLQKVLQKYRSSEQEKSRLLGIVSRKQERFLELINQKDIKIQKYENALWLMENGKEVMQEGLKERIDYIGKVWARKQEEMTAKKQEEIQTLESTPNKIKKPATSSTGGKTGKAGRKKEKEDPPSPAKKDCQIY